LIEAAAPHKGKGNRDALELVTEFDDDTGGMARQTLGASMIATKALYFSGKI
jgi:hypothetical protein